ncbi:DNA-directed RNA polymerase subunit alpha C-terminal domain-containing protein [Actinomadura geliboluensis]|uniref:DNA-directed RNA polymerase subunit alpha C-terminal domain-containing protein n=1 Tax=Actinomadura geliboluensis TaxID=882440 RepID=UPI003716AAF7
MSNDDYDETDPADEHGEAVLERMLAVADRDETEILNRLAIRAGLRWRCSSCATDNPHDLLLCGNIIKCGRPQYADVPLETLNLSARVYNRLVRAGIDSTPSLAASTPDRLLDHTTLTMDDIAHITCRLRPLGLRLATQDTL